MELKKKNYSDSLIPTSLDAMHKFAETYAKQTNTFFCIDPSVTCVVIKGLAFYKEKYGLPLCPCRNYENEDAELISSYWLCPCVAMRERKECHCKLFLNPSERESSESQKIDLQLILNDIL